MAEERRDWAGREGGWWGGGGAMVVLVREGCVVVVGGGGGFRGGGEGGGGGGGWDEECGSRKWGCECAGNGSGDWRLEVWSVLVIWIRCACVLLDL